jgi:hypothetical protein
MVIGDSKKKRHTNLGKFVEPMQGLSSQSVEKNSRNRASMVYFGTLVLIEICTQALDDPKNF